MGLFPISPAPYSAPPEPLPNLALNPGFTVREKVPSNVSITSGYIVDGWAFFSNVAHATGAYAAGIISVNPTTGSTGARIRHYLPSEITNPKGAASNVCFSIIPKLVGGSLPGTIYTIYLRIIKPRALDDFTFSAFDETLLAEKSFNIKSVDWGGGDSDVLDESNRISLELDLSTIAGSYTDGLIFEIFPTTLGTGLPTFQFARPKIELAPNRGETPVLPTPYIEPDHNIEVRKSRAWFEKLYTTGEKGRKYGAAEGASIWYTAATYSFSAEKWRDVNSTDMDLSTVTHVNCTFRDAAASRTQLEYKVSPDSTGSFRIGGGPITVDLYPKVV